MSKKKLSDTTRRADRKKYSREFIASCVQFRRRRRRNIFFVSVFIVLVIFLFSFFRFFSFDGNEVIITPASDISEEFVEDDAPADDELLQQINGVIAEEEGVYGVAVVDLSRGDVAYINEDEVFRTASLYKLWVLAEVYRQIEEGIISKDVYLSEDVEELNAIYDFASESAEMTEGEVSGTVEQLAEEMIVASANYPAYLLGVTVGMTSVQELVDSYGWENSHIGVHPETTARDIADYFDKLHRGGIVSEEASSEMVAILSRQTWSDRIPAPLPEGVRVAHKTGEFNSYKHDAGIVYAPYGDYVLVMLSDTPSQEEAVRVQAEISMVVWEYFEDKRDVGL